MKRIVTPWSLIVVLGMAVHSAAASDPSVAGNVSGLELCPQSVCGAAVFVGTFQGRVDGRFAIGSWAAAVRHEDPLPVEGETKSILGGQWQMSVWVLRGFWFERIRLSGQVLGGGQLVAWPGNLFNIRADMELDAQSGSGVILLDGVLSHNTFPPTFRGTLAQ